MFIILLYIYTSVPLDHMRFATPPSVVNSRLLNVSTVLQDHIGYLWFGSQDGLWRYDGYQLVGYRNDIDDPSSLAGNWVKGLAEDEDHMLWVASREGILSVLDPEKGSFTHYPMEPTGVRIESMLQDRSGNIWLGCERGLAKFDRKSLRFTWFRHRAQEVHNNITLSVIEDSHGQIWAGDGGGGICRVDPMQGCTKHIDFPVIDERYDDRQVWCGIQVDETLWFGTSHGIYVYDLNTEKVEFKVPDRFRDEIDYRVMVTRLLRDQNGRVWIGTRRYGVCVYQDGEFRYCAVKPGKPGGLAHSYVRSIFQDRGGIVWIGTLSGGVSKFDVNTPVFQVVDQNTEPGGLCSNFVKGIHMDKQGIMWIGGNSGLTRYDMTNRTFTCFDHDPNDLQSISSDYVRFIEDDALGHLWVGTFGNGLNKMTRNGQFERLSDEWPEPYLWIDAGYLDDQQRLWLGTVGGLLLLNTGDKSYQRIDIGIETTGRSRIRAIEPGLGSTIYVASHDGFTMIDSKTFEYKLYQTERQKKGSLSNNTVRAIFVDSRERVWVGTSAGLDLFDGRSFKVFGEKQGLANDVIYGILEEVATGRLWVSTNAGLSRFDPEKQTFLNFYVDDGLQGSEFNSGAAFALDDNQLFFGGTNGISYFHPLSFEPHVQEPLVAINEIKVLDEVFPIHVGMGQSPSLEFSPKQNFFSFEFAALDFSNPSRNLYQYRMEGVDDSWSTPSGRRYVNYPDLAPGSYQFQVRAANSEGVWSSGAATVDLYLRPHFYQTGWFAVLLFGLGASFIYGRMRVLSRQKQALEEVITQRTESLVVSNHDLEHANVALKDAQDQLVHRAHEAGMAEVAIEVVHNIGNVLNGLGITAETMKSSLGKSHTNAVKKVFRLLDDNQSDLTQFIEHDERGKKLIPYLKMLSEKLQMETTQSHEDLDQMIKAIDMMRETVQMQQDYANRSYAFREQVDIQTIVQDMISLQRTKLEQNQITVVTDFQPVPQLWIQRFKLAHVIANILVNAIDSIITSANADRTIHISVFEDQSDLIKIQIRDSGSGFAKDQGQKIFQYGFTTKPRGRGLGLHSCANAIAEMDGEIEAQSDGPQRGATFTLAFDASKQIEPANKNDG